MSRKNVVRKKDLTVDVVRHSGMIVVSALVGEHLETRKFVDYTKREAVSMFLDEMNGRG